MPINGHSVRGVLNGAAKLTEAQVRYIRTHYRPGHNTQTLANKFNVTRQAVYMAATGMTWGWLDD